MYGLKPFGLAPFGLQQEYVAPSTDVNATIAYDIGAIDCAVSANATSANATSTIAYDVGTITFAASSHLSVTISNTW